jgi:hypothetical protein
VRAAYARLLAVTDPGLHYEDRLIRLHLLVGDDGMVTGFTFVRCKIQGPAVVVLDDCVLRRNSLGGTPSELLWIVDPTERPSIVGAIGLRECTFESCVFEGVGFAGTAELLDGLLTDVRRRQ